MTAADARGPMVWDLPLRLAHWALAVCVTGSWATHYLGVEWFAWHRRFGYAVLVLVAFRIAWGFAGTRHARFAEFVYGPRRILDYLRGRAAPSVGHNPLGALSVLAMLAVLLLQAATGLFANDEIMNAGPLYGWVTQQRSNALTDVHHGNSELLLVLIVLHVAAVAWHAWRRGQPLVRAMVTGRKPAGTIPEHEAISGSKVGLALLIVLLATAVLAVAIRTAPEATIALF